MSTSDVASGGGGSGPRVIVTPFELRDYVLLLRWLIVAALIVVAYFAVVQLGLVSKMIEIDRTHLSILVTFVFFGTSIHCGVATVGVSRELNAARRVQRVIAQNPTGFKVVDDKVVSGDGAELMPCLLTDHVRNVIIKSRTVSNEPLDHTLLMHSLADGLRGRLQVGVFIVDALPKVGLIGTLIGFIFMLVPISAIKTFDPLTMKAAMSDMASGMSTALSVTLTALIASLVLKLQYYFLETGTIELHNIIAETTDLYVVPALARERAA